MIVVVAVGVVVVLAVLVALAVAADFIVMYPCLFCSCLVLLLLFFVLLLFFLLLYCSHMCAYLYIYRHRDYIR